MALVVNHEVVRDPFVRVSEDGPIPNDGGVLVALATWQANESTLRRREDPVGVILGSDEHPAAIAHAIEYLHTVALDFPSFRDGRAYSYARLLRERYGFAGELRAVGDVLLEQLHYMERVGFNAFEIDSDDPLVDLAIAARDFSVWYQPSADRRPSAAKLRSGVRPAQGRGA